MSYPNIFWCGRHGYLENAFFCSGWSSRPELWKVDKCHTSFALLDFDFSYEDEKSNKLYHSLSRADVRPLHRLF